MAAVPMVRNCMTHTASQGFNRGVGLPGIGSNRMLMYINKYIYIYICMHNYMSLALPLHFESRMFG